MSSLEIKNPTPEQAKALQAIESRFATLAYGMQLVQAFAVHVETSDEASQVAAALEMFAAYADDGVGKVFDLRGV